MKRRLFTSLAALSLLLCAGILALWIKCHYWLGDSAGWGWTQASANAYHTVQLDSVMGCLSFGGFTFVFDDPGAALTTWRETRFFWHSNMAPSLRRGWFESHTVLNSWGFAAYDLSTAGRGGTWTDWGIVVPDWFLMVILLILPATWLIGRGKYRHRWRHAHGLCAACGYDLRASIIKCPECDTAIPPATSPKPLVEGPNHV